MTNDTKLTNDQLTEMKDSFVEIMVDGMDTKTLARYVYDSMSEYYEKMNEHDFKEEMDNYDECLYDELMENALIEDEFRGPLYPELLKLRQYPIAAIDPPPLKSASCV